MYTHMWLFNDKGLSYTLEMYITTDANSIPAPMHALYHIVGNFQGVQLL